MSRNLRTAAITLAALSSMSPVVAQQAPPSLTEANPLQAERWQTRPLIVVAPAGDDPLLQRVDDTLREAAPREAFIEREMVLYRVVAGEATRNGEPLAASQTRAMLQALQVAPDGPATVLLVGKDGGTKLRQQGDADLDGIFKTIDRMPMRQQGR